MNCDQAAEWFGIYHDLPISSPERMAVGRHVAECAECAEQFRLWEESSEMIKHFPFADDSIEDGWTAARINSQVMDRIYAENSWFMPAVRKTYAFSSGFRKKVAMLLASLLAVFGCGFLYSVWNRYSGSYDPAAETVPVAGGAGSQTVEVPVASLSDPIVLHMSPVIPEYWVALSLLGMIVMLLMLNWLSRVRT